MAKKRRKKAPKTGSYAAALQQASKAAGTFPQPAPTRTRHPKGAATGGQFAAGAHAVDMPVEDLQLADQEPKQRPASPKQTSPQSPGKRPSQEQCLAYLSSQKATKKELAGHFKVSETTMSRVIDELNEDFIQAGPSERIVCAKKGQRTAWWHTTDPDEITTYVQEHGQVGRDFDIYVHEIQADGAPLILGTKTVRRDLPPPASVSHMTKVTERFAGRSKVGGEVPTRLGVLMGVVAQNLQHPAHYE